MRVRIHALSRNDVTADQKIFLGQATKGAILKSTTLAKEKAKLQAVINKWVRMSYADDNGMVHCYTCSSVRHYKELDAGHAVPGLKNHCRYDIRIIRPQCDTCNRRKSGNLSVFIPKLIKEIGMEAWEDASRYRDVQYLTYQIQALLQEWRGKLKVLAKKKGFEL